jgi:hypothetical protein
MSKSAILGLSVYGPTGLMFTIDKSYNVQQYDLYPPRMVANVQHKPTSAPPSPPISVGKPNFYDVSVIETNRVRKQVSNDNSRPGSNRANDMERSVSQRSVTDRPGSKDSKFSMDTSNARAIAGIKRDDTRTPLGQIAHELEMLEEMEKSHLKSTGMSRSESMQSTGSGHQKAPSIASSIRSYNSGISGIESPLVSPRLFDDQATPRRFHPLSQEIGMSPITPKAPAGALQNRYTDANGLLSPPIDGTNAEYYDEHLYFVPPIGQLELFPNLKDRIATITYKTPLHADRPKYDDERRKEMFATVFGFDGDAEALIREESKGNIPQKLVLVC